MKRIAQLFHLFGDYRRDLVIAALLVFVETCFELIIPTMMADLIDNGVAYADVEYMFLKGGQMALCAILARPLGR